MRGERIGEVPVRHEAFPGHMQRDAPTVVEVRRLTDEERRAEQLLYCLVGFSHWNPASFFEAYADKLDAEAELHRAAARLIRNHEAAP